MAFPVVGFWPDLQYQAQIPSWGVDLKCIQKMIGYWHNGHATTASNGHALPAPKQGKSIDYFPLHSLFSIFWHNENWEVGMNLPG